jgi:hypothetical protein
MRWNALLLLTGSLAGSPLPAADTLQLKDDATLSGRILAEKSDQVFLDVGYTVLTVPRSQIAKIVREETLPASPSSTSKDCGPAAASASASGETCRTPCWD